jgi:hypothetical protein
MVTKGNAFHLS